MSYKQKVFTTLITQPAVLSNYSLSIEGLPDISLIAEAATFPIESRGEVAVYYRGQPIYFPTKSKVPGTWQCTVNEDVFGIIISELKAKMVDQMHPSIFQSDNFEITENFDPFTIKVSSYFQFDYASAVQSTLFQKNVVNIENGVPGAIFKALKGGVFNSLYSVDFKLKTIASQLSSVSGANPSKVADESIVVTTFSCVLNGCWIQNIEELKLNASDPTAATKWTFNVRYDYIDNFLFNPIAFAIRKVESDIISSSAVNKVTSIISKI